MTIHRYERNGEVWECKPLLYVRYNGTPCIQLDMRGNSDTFFGADAIIVEVCDLGDGWSRYWYQSSDAGLQQGICDLVAAYER